MTDPAADQDERPDNVIMLHEPDGSTRAVRAGDVAPEVREAARDAAAQRRAEFEYRRAGANARAGRLDKSLTAAWGHGVANLMLGKILTGELEPATAKEAADVAKTAHELARSASGRAASDGPMTDEDRRKMMDEADQLGVVLATRAKQLAEKNPIAGADPDGDVPEPTEWDFGDADAPDGNDNP